MAPEAFAGQIGSKGRAIGTTRMELPDSLWIETSQIPRHNFFGSFAGSIEPLVKLSERYRMLHRRVPYQHPDFEVLSEVFDPTALSDGFQPERDLLVQRVGCHLRRVLNSF